MRRCKHCGHPLPPDSAPQRRYCPAEENPDCNTERDAYRKAKERACADNTYKRVVLALPDRPKRKTGSGRDERTGELDPGGPRSRWDEVAAAWQRANLRRVDTLMTEAERAVRRIDRSAGTPAGQFRDVNRMAEWKAGDKEHSVVDTARSCPGCVGVSEDAGDPAELWLRGDTERAVAKAEKQVRELQRLVAECGA